MIQTNHRFDIAQHRSADFWDDLGTDPDVAASISRSNMTVSEIAALPMVRQFSGPNGGYLAFDMLMSHGRFWDIHAAFRRHGWGKEALEVGRYMIATLFDDGAVAITNLQKEGHWRQRPPRSFGFRPIGETPHGITSLLTREMWYASPAYKRMGR